MNQDTLHRKGASYVGKHAPDLMKSKDKWFRGVELGYGPDGGVYVLDWSDIGECHENDGIHRTSGRVFKITHGKAKPVTEDLRKLSSPDLAKLQIHANDWHVRQARRLLQERAVVGRADIAQAQKILRGIYSKSSSIPHRLRAMWAMNVTGSLDEGWLLKQTHADNEHIRVWAIKLLNDSGTPSATALKRFVQMGKTDVAGLVQLHLASTLQLLPHVKRWELAAALVSHDKYANDPVLPLMVWYGINPAVTENRTEAVKLIPECKLPKVRQFIARRLAGGDDKKGEKTDR
jgi:hypothetical protein